MAGDTEDLVISISADTKQITNAINRLLGTVNSSTSGIEKAFSRSGDAMDKAGTSATRLQKQIESLTGVNAGFSDRGKDIEAYGAQLDAIRAKYNPLFAAQQTYTKSLGDIRQAVKIGALTEKEGAAAISATKSAFVDNVKAINGASDAHAKFTTQSQALFHAMRSGAESIALGVPPSMVLTQQLNHLSYAATGPGGLSEAFKGVSGMVAGLITPARLLGVGVAATAAAAYASYGSWKAYTLQLDDTAKTVNTTTGELSKLQAAAAFKGIGVDEFTKGIEAFGHGVYEAQHNMGSLAEVFRVNGKAASDFSGSLDTAADLIAKAKNDQQRLVLLQQMGLPATMEWVRYLAGGADGLKKAKDAAAQFVADDSLVNSARKFDDNWNRAWTNFALNARSAFQRALDGGAGFFDRVEKLAQKAGNADFWKGLYDQKSAAAAGVSLTNNFEGRYSGDSSNPSSGNTTLLDGLRKRADAIVAGNTKDPNQIKNDISREQQYLGLLGATTTATEARRQVELQLQAAAIAGVKVDGTRAEVLKKLAEENNLGITAMKQQADAYRVEASVVGMSAGQTAAYSAAQNALNDARRNGKALTAQNISDINKEAQALGDAAQKAANAKIAYDISFNRKTALFTDEDVQIAQTLAQKFGGDITAALNSSDAAAIRFNNTLKQIGGLTQDVTKSFATDFAQQIRNGASEMDAFKTAGLNALGKISDKLISMAVDNLFSNALGGSGAGGLLGALGKLLGFSSGGAVSGGTGFSTTTTGGLYDSGGFTGLGGKYQPAGIVHKGEVVWSQDDVRKAGGVGIVEAMRLGRSGYAGGGPVGLPSFPAVPTAANDNSMISAPVNISIDARGADSNGLAALQAQLAQMQAELPSRVVHAVQDAKNRRVLA